MHLAAAILKTAWETLDPPRRTAFNSGNSRHPRVGEPYLPLGGPSAARAGRNPVRGASLHLVIDALTDLVVG
jgi:hypothetical protein